MRHSPPPTPTIGFMSTPAAPVHPDRDRLIELQRLLLPKSLPSVGCTEIAAEYRAHNDDLRLGGDWYDVIDRTDNRVVAIVGDVVGHGLEQISVMGQLRAAANALGRSSANPGDLLRDLDFFACDLPGAEYTTATVLMLDGTNTASIAAAGHPPLIHVTREGAVKVIEAGRRPPLTLGSIAPVWATFDYEVDDLMVMFTDGLIERRGVPLDDAIASVGRLLVEHIAAPCRDIAARVIDELAGDAQDDIALMVLRPRNHRSPDHLLDVRQATSARIH